MMCSRLLRGGGQHSRFYRWSEPFFERLTAGYQRSLQTFLRRRWQAWVLVALTGFGIYFLGKAIPSELAPLEDRNRISIQSTGPEGSSYDFMDAYMRQAGELVRDSMGNDLDNVLSVTAPSFSGNGSNTGIMRVLLKPADERNRSQQQIADVLTGSIKKLTAARASVSQDQSIGSGGGGLPVQFVLQTQDFEKLRTAVPKFLEAAKADPRSPSSMST